MIPADIAIELQADPERFVGTCWVFRQRATRAVQIVHIDGDRALAVTWLHPPLRKWWVPIKSLLVDFSAFDYVCRDDEVGWLRQGAYVAALQDMTPVGTPVYGVVVGINSASVYIRRLNAGQTEWMSGNIDFDEFMQTWRPVTSEEESFADYLHEQSRMIADPSDGPVVLPKPPLSEPPVSDGPSLYERLLDD